MHLKLSAPPISAICVFYPAEFLPRSPISYDSSQYMARYMYMHYSTVFCSAMEDIAIFAMNMYCSSNTACSVNLKSNEINVNLMLPASTYPE